MDTYHIFFWVCIDFAIGGFLFEIWFYYLEMNSIYDKYNLIQHLSKDDFKLNSF